MSQEKEADYDETGRKVYSGKAILPVKNAPIPQDSEQSKQSGAADEEQYKHSVAVDESAHKVQKNKKRGKKTSKKDHKAQESIHVLKKSKNMRVVPTYLKPVGANKVPKVEGDIIKEENITEKNAQDEVAQISRPVGELEEKAKGKKPNMDKVKENALMHLNETGEKEEKDSSDINKIFEKDSTEVEAAQGELRKNDNIQYAPQQADLSVGPDVMQQTEKENKNAESDSVQGEDTQQTQSVGGGENDKITQKEDKHVEQHVALSILDDETEGQNEQVLNSREVDEKKIEDDRKRPADHEDPEPVSVPEGKKIKAEESPQKQSVERSHENKTMDLLELEEVFKHCDRK